MWHDAQAAVTVTWVWFHFVGVQPAGLTLWHEKQPAVVGTWLPGLPAAALPLWQLAQLVAALNDAWSVRAPAQVLVLRWQLSQLPVTVAWVALLGLPTALRYVPVWQLAHPVVTDTLACRRPLAQVE